MLFERFIRWVGWVCCLGRVFKAWGFFWTESIRGGEFWALGR